jgi:DNA polymerase-4
MIQQDNLMPTGYYIKLKYEYYVKEKHTLSLNREFSEPLFKEQILALFSQLDRHKSLGIIAITITLSGFSSQKPVTKNIFYYQEDQKLTHLTKKLHSLREKYGIDIIKDGNELW